MNDKGFMGRLRDFYNEENHPEDVGWVKALWPIVFFMILLIVLAILKG